MARISKKDKKLKAHYCGKAEAHAPHMYYSFFFNTRQRCQGSKWDEGKYGYGRHILVNQEPPWELR